MNNETQKVNARAILNRVHYYFSGREAQEIVACRDAVTELIAAARELRAACRELPSNDFETASGVEARQKGESRIGDAHYALESALARFGGE